jgi:hypothetical protein
MGSESGEASKIKKSHNAARRSTKYCQEICNKEMPQGLKQYMELELFPRIHIKVGMGISVSTGLQHEGLKFTLHKNPSIMMAMITLMLSKIARNNSCQPWQVTNIS